MKRHGNTTTYNSSIPAEGLPESPELERAILGALILEPDYLSDVAEIVESTAFYTPQNKNIYDEMLAMLERNEKIDLYTLIHRCKGVPGIEHPASYLASLTSVVDSGVNVLEHARRLKDTETRRRLCLFGQQLAARAASDPDGVLDWATAEITAIAATTTGADDITPLSEIVRRTLENLERRQKASQAGACIGIPTGLHRLDVLTGGWRGGQLIVIAGRPGMGKSAVMLHFARVAAASGVPVCVFSLEMPSEQLAGRMLIGGSGIESGTFRTGDVASAEWAQLERAGANISALPVYLNDQANTAMRTMRSIWHMRSGARCHSSLPW